MSKNEFVTDMKEPEVPVRVVVAAANRAGDVVVVSARHHDVLMNSLIRRMKLINVDEWEQGFVDQWGVFMTREEALEVAEAAGQLNFRRPKHPPYHKLFSEDLY